MIEKCIRVVGVIIETITSVFKKRSPFRVDPVLPHGIPFSFHPASADIHPRSGRKSKRTTRRANADR